MGEKPIHDERILEAIEACRPGIDNLADADFAHLATAIAADPELEDLYERLQAVDTRVAAAMHDVAVPEGLARRLTDQLAAARVGSLGLAEAMDSPAPECDAPARPQKVSRRWLVAAGGAFTAAAALLVVVLVNMMKEPGVDELFKGGMVARFEDLYDRLSGHTLWSGLKELENKLRQYGVQMSQVESPRMSTHLVSQYVSIKRRQLL